MLLSPKKVKLNEINKTSDILIIIKSKCKKTPKHLFRKYTQFGTQSPFIKISKITTECLLTITSNYYFNLTWGLKMIILSHSWYMSQVTAWSRLCSLPFRRSEQKIHFQKEINISYVFLSSSDPSRPAGQCFMLALRQAICSSMPRRCWRVTAGGGDSVWSRQTAVVRLSLKTVTCFCRSMLLSQLTVAASGRVVVLPVLISHLHEK